MAKRKQQQAVGHAVGQINTDTGKVNEVIKPAAEPVATAAAVAPTASAPNKQEAMFVKLKAAWVARGVDLSNMTATLDGKYLMVEVGDGWPTIQIGSNGGIDLPQ